MENKEEIDYVELDEVESDENNGFGLELTMPEMDFGDLDFNIEMPEIDFNF